MNRLHFLHMWIETKSDKSLQMCWYIEIQTYLFIYLREKQHYFFVGFQYNKFEQFLLKSIKIYFQVTSFIQIKISQN